MARPPIPLAAALRPWRQGCWHRPTAAVAVGSRDGTGALMDGSSTTLDASPPRSPPPCRQRERRDLEPDSGCRREVSRQALTTNATSRTPPENASMTQPKPSPATSATSKIGLQVTGDLSPGSLPTLVWWTSVVDERSMTFTRTGQLRSCWAVTGGLCCRRAAVAQCPTDTGWTESESPRVGRRTLPDLGACGLPSEASHPTA